MAGARRIGASASATSADRAAIPIGPWTAMFDHCLWYRGDRRCAAIVAQPYGHATQAEALKIARQHGVACHAPPFAFLSFHFPGATKLFVFAKTDHRIVWLPDQMSGWGKALGGSNVLLAFLFCDIDFKQIDLTPEEIGFARGAAISAKPHPSHGQWLPLFLDLERAGRSG
jgi:hypothetical protein